MTEAEFDARLTARLGRYAGSRQLPDDFADRLIGAARRRRRLGRVRAGVCLVALILASVLAIGYLGTGEPPSRSAEAALVATDGPNGRSEQASGFFLLGFIRECFRRERTTRRKEEE